MIKRKTSFSKAPRLSSRARPADHVVPGEMPLEVREFKHTYVLERRILERFRSGVVSHYTPSPSLDGKVVVYSPEVRPSENKWLAAYQQIKKFNLGELSPAHYVRVLFKLLRGSSLAIPTVPQLANEKLANLVLEYLKFTKYSLRADFIAETQRATSAITINQKAGGCSLALAVYYAVVDSRLELSSLFKYCLAVSTVEQIRNRKSEDVHCDKLNDLAKQYEFMAVMDYTLFPDLYESIWKKAIPDRLRVAAKSYAKQVV